MRIRVRTKKNGDMSYQPHHMRRGGLLQELYGLRLKGFVLVIDKFGLDQFMGDQRLFQGRGK